MGQKELKNKEKIQLFLLAVMFKTEIWHSAFDPEPYATFRVKNFLANLMFWRKKERKTPTTQLNTISVVIILLLL